jgi:ATP-dependent Clp protease ATP-binding subunit ClpA
MMFDNYSRAAIQAMFLARLEAGRVGSEAIDTVHLLLALVRVDALIFQQIGARIDLDLAREHATAWHTQSEKIGKNKDLPMTGPLMDAVYKARTIAEAQNSPFVRTEHLLLALMTTPSHAAIMLEESGALLERMEILVSELKGEGQPEAIPWPMEELS